MAFLDNAGLKYFYDKLKLKFLSLSGGTLTGKLTANAGIEVTGDSKFKNNLDVEGILNMKNPIRSTKAEFLQTTVPVVKGTAPASNLWSYWSIMDQNGFSNESNRLAHIDYSVASDKTSGLGFFVAKYEAGDSPVDLGMFIRWYQGVTPQIMLTHNPPDDSSDASVATTHFVNQKINANKTQLVRW